MEQIIDINRIETDFVKRTREKNRQSQDFRRFITWKSSGAFISKYLGADIWFIREWLENMFIEGMTWENYGSLWVVDHIVPIRTFDIFDEAQLHICWNYRNLMPLLNKDNGKKHGNVFFAFELLYERRFKDDMYSKLFNHIRPEVEWMVKYIDNYDSKSFK